MAQEEVAQGGLLLALKAEEEFWKEKSRLNWELSSDRNTRYIHKIAKIRHATKSMTMLRDGDDIILDQQEIANHVLEYFHNLYASQNNIQHSNLIIPSLVSEGDNLMVSSIPLNEEIRDVVFTMNGDGAPGPDVEDPSRIDRHIQDCVCLASEPIDLLDHKAFGGNLAIKLDVKKACYTIDWKFLLDTLQDFGFHTNFIKWIGAILNSSKLSIFVNGQNVGFFSCKIGVRQGDPLSSLLFCMAEDVLSRGISKLLQDGKISTISGPRINTPSHVLYVDDILIFCKGINKELMDLKDLFIDYAHVSGQSLNLNKCKFYTTQASARKVINLTNWLGFGTGQLPFTYHGVPLFKGKPKAIHLQPIADRIVNKLAKWKGSSLSIMGRVEIVKSIIHNMLVYSFHVYNWPVNLLRRMENCIRNFIWSRNTLVKKLVTIAWHKVVFFRDRFCKGSRAYASYIKSSVWSGIKKFWHFVTDNSIWLVGNDNKINYWMGNWIGYPLVEYLGIPDQISSSLMARVADFIQDSSWIIPCWLARLYLEVCNSITNMPISNTNQLDKLAWIHSADGILSMKEAYLITKPMSSQHNWCKLIWSIAIPPSKSFVTWRLYNNKMPTDEKLKAGGLAMGSICNLSRAKDESSDHLFFQCRFARAIWRGLGTQIGCSLDNSSITSLLLISNSWSPLVKDVLVACILNAISTIWYCRNKSRFDNIVISLAHAMTRIKVDISFTGNFSKLCVKNSLTEFSLLKAFKVKGNYNKAPSITKVMWQAPSHGWVKVNSDGAAHGCPELLAAIFADTIAHSKGWNSIWLECDSKLVVGIFLGSKQVPWKLSSFMNKCRELMNSIQIMTTTRRRSRDNVPNSPLGNRATRRMLSDLQADVGVGSKSQGVSNDLEEEMKAEEEELEAEEEDCVKLVCIEDSIEVVDLSSDSETEEDPNECPSTPTNTRASH
ncbi:PREDICTED: uncharacterized protein LOC109359931 [Lupinus angustifolius]|uniref:uncharacterized protein LOC109359931 n=1 Tax=Lupinus angustifolius TaxID=3871 RepID=UPI00092F8F94|nr:PREDICTED: uncharacterized protein LOC109359931 [Lupinus angustifolius]